jgi:NitT/TauT family transport system ATP-binding protein
MNIKINNITKSFGNQSIFYKLSFVVNIHEIVTIVGPSGSGKTTLLNIISKIEKPDDGNIIYSLGSKIGFMMQEPPLLPWRNLEENAVLGIEVAKITNHDTKKYLSYYFDIFDLEDYKRSYPGASSGGMKQRVALIRTLLLNPDILLLDEPFSNLDFDIKLKIQRYLLEYQRQQGTTIILVTHDIEDAIALSDRVIVFSDKPTSIKADIPIDLRLPQRDPVEARKSHRFRDYFVRIWDELKYLDNHEPV